MGPLTYYSAKALFPVRQELMSFKTIGCAKSFDYMMGPWALPILKVVHPYSLTPLKFCVHSFFPTQI